MDQDIPANVKKAIKCIWAAFAVSVASWIVALFFPMAPQVPGQADYFNISDASFVYLKLALLVAFWTPVYFLLLKQVAKGKNWARILFLIYGAIQLPQTIGNFLGYTDVASRLLSSGFNAVYYGLYLYALYLLFTAPGKSWFYKTKQQAVEA